MGKELVNILKGKKVAVVVAHQDDETLYACGLMTELAPYGEIVIASMSKPSPNRKDTFTRQTGFDMIADILKATAYTAPFWGGKRDHRTPKEKMQKYLDKLFRLERPDAVITHNPRGEAHGHFYHKKTSAACLKLKEKFGYSLYNFAKSLGRKDYLVEYDVEKKKELIDCYLPGWKPGCYHFVYRRERFVKA